jgi:hypothetical protein
MNNVEDDVGLNRKLYMQRSKSDFISANDNNRINKSTIDKVSFGKSIVDRLDYEYDKQTIQYFKIVGESQTFTYNNNVFTTKNQNHYLWKLSGQVERRNNIYNSQIQNFVNEYEDGKWGDVGYVAHCGKMIGTLELNFVPEYKSTDFDIVKILIPVFKTNRINKNGTQLLNCIRGGSDVAIPTKNIDMGDFIPKNIPYLINKFDVNSKENSIANCENDDSVECKKTFNIQVGVFVFTSSNIHVDDNVIHPRFFNTLQTFGEINIGYQQQSDVTQEIAIAWFPKGIQTVSHEKNCKEIYYEGETLTHSTDKISKISGAKISFEKRIGKLVKSQMGLQIVIISLVSIIYIVYKFLMGGLVSSVGEATTTKSNYITSMTKAGTHYSAGAWILFIGVFIAFVHLMKDDWIEKIKI